MMNTNVIAGLVSTIIPVFNRPDLLHRAVTSVLNQTYALIEIIIVDDGSTDDTLSVAKDLESKHDSIRVISIENAGPGAAREAGRLIAKGEFIQYLDSDDTLLPEKFTKQLAQLELSPDCDVCYCQTSYQQADGKIITPLKRTGEQIKTIIPSMLASRWWDTSTPLYTRKVVDLAGPWQNWINEEDWEYDCRIGFISQGLAYVPEVLSLQIEHQEPRLSQGGGEDPEKLKSRVRSRLAIIEQAQRHPGATDSEEFVTHLKYSLLLSRQCGAAGLTSESSTLFYLAAQHLRGKKINVLTLNVYEFGARLMGWSTMAKLSQRLDKFRP